MISAVFIIVPAGKTTAVFTSPLPGPVPVAGGLRICRTDIITPGPAIRLPIGLTMGCRIITRVTTAGTSMSALAGTGRAGIAIADITGMAAIRIIGMVRL